MADESKTKREVKLELQLWRERVQLVQTQATNLNMQTQLLQHQAVECADNVKRLEDELAAFAPPPVPDAPVDPPIADAPSAAPEAN